MQLTPQESSTAFWGGVKTGVARAVAYVAVAGVAVGLVSAIFPSVAIGLGAAVLTAASTILTIGMYSGHNALAQYHQQKHNAMYEAKIARLEGEVLNEPTIEDNVAHVQHSPKISTILEQGARSVDSTFAHSEEERAAGETKAPTIH